MGHIKAFLNICFDKKKVIWISNASWKEAGVFPRGHYDKLEITPEGNG